IGDGAILDEAAVGIALHPGLQHRGLARQGLHGGRDAVGGKPGAEALAGGGGARRALRGGARHRLAPAGKLEGKDELAHQNTMSPRASSPAASARKASLASSSP